MVRSFGLLNLLVPLSLRHAFISDWVWPNGPAFRSNEGCCATHNHLEARAEKSHSRERTKGRSSLSEGRMRRNRGPVDPVDELRLFSGGARAEVAEAVISSVGISGGAASSPVEQGKLKGKT